MHRWVKQLPVLVALGGVCVGGPSRVTAQRVPQDGEWRHYSGDTHGTKYSPLDQITKDNVKNLRVAWRWPFADRALQESNPLLRTTRTQDTPLMVNGVALHGDRPGAGRGARSGDRRDPLGLRPARATRPASIRRRASFDAASAYWTDGDAERAAGRHGGRLSGLDRRANRASPTRRSATAARST